MMLSLNERVRRLSGGRSKLYEDEYEHIWIEEQAGSRRRLRRLGTLLDAERFLARLEKARRGNARRS
jgi:hypothetical protein